MVTPVIPPLTMMSSGWYSQGCISLTVTSKNAKIRFDVLRQWNSLAEVKFPDHKKYCDKDGVVFSKDGKTLLFYPNCRRDVDYQIPAGTTKIGREAFSGQYHLRRVSMGDQVKTIGQGSFCECRALEKVRLSEGISEIPDANVFSAKGVFSGCKKLSSVVFPSKLKDIGSYAFSETGLSEIIIPEKVERIGDYAFAPSALKEVHLPKSCRTVGKGAFFQAESATAYEGTARGLISALEAVIPGDGDNLPNLCWHEVRIYMISKGGETEEIWIPLSLKRASAVRIDTAWNSSPFDYEEYESCFSDIKEPDEKLEFASLAVRRIGGLTLYQDMPLIEPLEYKEMYTIHEFVIAIDTSGSCDLELVKKFLIKTYDILCETVIFGNDLNIYIIQCDAYIQKETRINNLEELEAYMKDIQIYGRGGTDFRPVFNRIRGLREEGKLSNLRGLLYFTDGYGIFPHVPTDYKTAFVFAECDEQVEVPPWAMKVYIEDEEL